MILVKWTYALCSAAIVIERMRIMLHENMDIIDSHIHIRGSFRNPAEVLDTSLRFLSECGLSSLNAASIPHWDRESRGQNLLYILFKAMNPGKVFAFGGLEYYLPGIPKEGLDFETQAQKLIEMGFDGMKMVEGKPTVRKNTGDIPLDSPLYAGYYRFMETRQLPILLHVGDPERNWITGIPEKGELGEWYYGDGGFVEKETLYAEVENILAHFPKLRIYFAHFYFLSADLERAADFLDRWPAVSFDITPGREMYFNFSSRPGDWHDFFTKYQDRILFGTDNGWGNDLSATEKLASARENVTTVRNFLESHGATQGWGKEMQGIYLDRDVLNKIYAGNFIRLAGKTPKPVDIRKAVSYCEDRCAAYSREEASDAHVIDQMNQVLVMMKKLL
jgi:predicted TIM-barrel fold metal-dependent hydrolase